MTTRRIARYAKLVRHDEVHAWLALGWMLHRDLNGRYPCDGTYQGEYAALLVWPCDCPVRRPAKPEEPQGAFWETIRREHIEEEYQRDRDEEREFGWSV